MGCCNHLKLKWEYDIPEFVRIIKQYDEDEALDITYKRNFLYVEGKSDSFLSSAHNVANQSEQELPYVVPITVQETPVQLRIPSPYLALYEAYLYVVLAHIAKGNATHISLQEPGPIKLTLKYRDIGNEQMNQEYQLDFHCVALMQDKPDDSGPVRCMQGDVEPTKMK